MNERSLTVSVAVPESATISTVADLLDRLGGIPAERIRLNPSPGTATEEDLIRLLDAADKRICELIDGVLVEKAMGAKEGLLGGWIGHMLWSHLDEHDVGLVMGDGSPVRVRLGLVRVPDVSFVSWSRIPGDEFPDDPVSKIIPDLAIEVLSRSNTVAEIELKLDHYFDAGVRLVWVIDPKKKKARIYTSRSRIQEIGPEGVLVGGKILPGFRLPLANVFASARRKKRKPR